MLLLQLSAGKGPDECARAVALAMRRLTKECEKLEVGFSTLELVKGHNTNTYKSVLLELHGANAEQLAEQWQGVMQWICTSPFRPGHKRKNWFFSGCVYEIDDHAYGDTIRFQTCRSSGAGGQHVNTTDSAVQATHIETGITVRVESERSQHSNKRMATLLIQQKLADLQRTRTSAQSRRRWVQHGDLERGNPVRVFKGNNFK